MNGVSTVGDFLVVLGEKMGAKVLELSVLVLPVPGGITTDYLGLDRYRYLDRDRDRERYRYRFRIDYISLRGQQLKVFSFFLYFFLYFFRERFT